MDQQGRPDQNSGNLTEETEQTTPGRKAGRKVKIMNKQLKDAATRVLLAKIDRQNYGMFGNVKVSARDQMDLRNAGITSDDNYIYEHGAKVYKINRRYAAKKVDGMYKQLKPQLEPM